VTIGILIANLLDIYSLLIIARAILSWIRIDQRNQFVRILSALTDPVLNPIQRVVPLIGGTIDISPVVAFFAVQLIKTMVLRLLA